MKTIDPSCKGRTLNDDAACALLNAPELCGTNPSCEYKSKIDIDRVPMLSPGYGRNPLPVDSDANWPSFTCTGTCGSTTVPTDWYTADFIDWDISVDYRCVPDLAITVGLT